MIKLRPILLSRSADPLSQIHDLTTKVATSQKKKKQFNFLTGDRFVQGKDTYPGLKRSEGNRSSIFALLNSNSFLIQAKFKSWLEEDFIKSAKYIPNDLMIRFVYSARLVQPVTGLLNFATESLTLHRSVRNKHLHLPFDLRLQAKHALVCNFARSPEASEWQKKLNLENVDLTKGIFRDQPINDILCYYVQSCYGKVMTNPLATKLFTEYESGKMPTKEIIREILTATVGEPQVTFSLRLSDLPLSHQAVVAATILYRNHPLMPQSYTIIGSAKLRYDELVNKRSVESHTRTSTDGDRQIPNILDPNYSATTDLCGIADFLDSAAYLGSPSKLVKHRNKKLNDIHLFPKFSNKHTYDMWVQYNPQFEFICRVVNCMSADEKLKMINFVDKYQFRMCRELEREVVGLSALSAYVIQRQEHRFLDSPRDTYLSLFNSAAMLYSCTCDVKNISKHLYATFSADYRMKFSINIPEVWIPNKGATLWEHLYRRESHARGNKFGVFSKTTLSAPFEYGDGATIVTCSDFGRMSVIQRAACDYCFPAKLSMGESGKTYSNPFNNYGTQRLKELKAKSGMSNIPFPSLISIIAREWFQLPQEVKNQFDMRRIVIEKSPKASFPLSDNRKSKQVIDINNLPSEPLATPLAPISLNIQNRPHIVNLGRYKPSDEHIHKDPLAMIGFVDPCQAQSIEFFGNKALEILNTRLDAKRIVNKPSDSTTVSTITTEKSKHKVPSKLGKLPQQNLPPVVLAELAQSGLFDQKQPISFDFEMSKEACDFRINTLRSENAFRTAIVTNYCRTTKWEGAKRARDETISRLRELGEDDLSSKMVGESTNNLIHGGSRHDFYKSPILDDMEDS